MKIYAAMEALTEKERHDETQFITKIDGFWVSFPLWMLTYSFAVFFFGISPCVDQTQDFDAVFSLFYG